MSRLFGTDGVRGLVNQKITPELAYKLGEACAFFVVKEGKEKKITIGMDTRISKDMLECALISGITSMGVDVYRLGVIPTPAISYLTEKLGCSAGVVISASHNPVCDNGIKFFSHEGLKLPDSAEDLMEEIIRDGLGDFHKPVGSDVGKIVEVSEAKDIYSDFLFSAYPWDLKGKKVVIDSANGSTSNIIGPLFRRLGCTVVELSHSPNGLNINDNCGSTHLGNLITEMKKGEYFLGIANDGDGDRMLAVDEKGEVIDGDQIMAITAKYLKEKNLLRNNLLVGTIMSNMGLGKFCEEQSIDFLPTKVGDRYVIEAMLEKDGAIGGEQSGHVIFRDYVKTGDGILGALMLLHVICHEDKLPSEAKKIMKIYPQILKNYHVSDKKAALNDPSFQELLGVMEQRLQGTGRIVVRESGTEELIRIMAEGENIKEIEEIVDALGAKLL